MKVGSVVTLRVECLGNKAGTVGVCYETYGSNFGYSLREPGCSFIFANGRYDGFSPDEQKHFLIHQYDSDLKYNFTNVMQLITDFDKDVFSPYLVILFKDVSLKGVIQ